MTRISRSISRSSGVLFLNAALLASFVSCGAEELSLKPPYFAASTDVIDFGEVGLGGEEEQTLYIINKGDKTLQLEPANGNTLGGVFGIVLTDAEILPMADSVARVVFQPLVSATYETTMTISNDSLNQPSFTVTLRGVGIRTDPCEGVVCYAPPSSCFSAYGECHDGACIYTALTAVACNDNDPCTLNDTCQDGTCRGTSRDCSAPPQTVCRDSQALLTYDPQGTCEAGVCRYLSRDVSCQHGCQGGLCEGDLCAGGCDDGNPCTRDSCRASVGCVHEPNSGASCVAPSGDCPLGTCVDTTCVSVAGTTCVAEVRVDLCADTQIAGVCSANGQCAVQEVPPQLTCPGCPGVCVQCYLIQLCIPI